MLSSGASILWLTGCWISTSSFMLFLNESVPPGGSPRLKPPPVFYLWNLVFSEELSFLADSGCWSYTGLSAKLTSNSKSASWAGSMLGYSLSRTEFSICFAGSTVLCSSYVNLNSSTFSGNWLDFGPRGSSVFSLWVLPKTYDSLSPSPSMPEPSKSFFFSSSAVSLLLLTDSFFAFSAAYFFFLLAQQAMMITIRRRATTPMIIHIIYFNPYISCSKKLTISDSLTTPTSSLLSVTSGLPLSPLLPLFSVIFSGGCSSL